MPRASGALCRARAIYPAAALALGRICLRYTVAAHDSSCRYTPPGESLPIATAVGSSNFGYRSLERDLECQLFVVTANLRLRQVIVRRISHAYLT